MLHGASELEREPSGSISDVDLAVTTPAAVLLPLLVHALPEHGLYVIVEWNYDIGGATTLILSTRDASQGVQLDLLSDADGVGIDGLRTPWILQQKDRHGRWPSANSLHELLYLIRKRDRKGDVTALRALVQKARADHPRDRLRVEAFKVFRGPVARRVCALLDGARPDAGARPMLAPRARTARWRGRLEHPVGFWAECETEAGSTVDVRTIVDAFGRFMPYSRVGRRPAGAVAFWPWYARDVAPVRWRPGLFTSSASAGTPSNLLQPDLVIRRGSTPHDAQCEIVSAMETRVRKRAAAVVNVGRLESDLGVTVAQSTRI